jgi:hypothetical protein
MSSFATIAALIRQHRFPLNDEKATQAALAEVLAGAGIAFEREVRLSPGDIPDFMLPGGIVIEVKLRCPRRQVIRQLERYAKHERVTGFILVSNTAMSLPDIDGKPVQFVSLGQGWL